MFRTLHKHQTVWTTSGWKTGHCSIIRLYYRALRYHQVVLQSTAISSGCITEHCSIIRLYYRALRYHQDVLQSTAISSSCITEHCNIISLLQVTALSTGIFQSSTLSSECITYHCNIIRMNYSGLQYHQDVLHTTAVSSRCITEHCNISRLIRSNVISSGCITEHYIIIRMECRALHYQPKVLQSPEVVNYAALQGYQRRHNVPRFVIVTRTVLWPVIEKL